MSKSINTNAQVAYIEQLRSTAKNEGKVMLSPEELDKVVRAIMSVAGASMIDSLEEDIMAELRKDTEEVAEEFNQISGSQTSATDTTNR